MQKLSLRIAAAALAATTLAACGARTGLPVPEASECVSLHATAGLADLDVFIMMDSSGSMNYLTAEGTSKWQAVRDALASFLLDPASSGVGAAISFFPVVDESIPALCSGDPVCGVTNACKKIKVCLPDGGGDCESNDDCAAAGFPGDTCYKIGFCENDDQAACLPEEGVGCDAATQGACLDVGFCENHYECAVAAYDAPAVDVASLPGASTNVLEAIDERTPEGSTTTLPALQGAIARAMANSQLNPSHKSIVVLATDGFPTQCDPAIEAEMPELAISHLADSAGNGVGNGVQTFVIGVFGPDEQAMASSNLDAIAKGGGSDGAFLISTADDVTGRFLEALSDVRITAKSCDFAIPESDGEAPNASRMTVQITPPGGEPVEVSKRASAAACDSEEGGFYYDKEPGGPVPPARVILCPATCDLFGSSANRTIDLRVACD